MRRRGLAVVLKERAARVRAHQHKDAAACGCTDLDEGVERVRTIQGFTVTASAAKGPSGAKWSVRRPRRSRRCPPASRPRW